MIEDYVMSSISTEHYTPVSYKDAISCKDKDNWLASMDTEYNTHLSMNTFNIVDRPPNVNVLPCKWVYKVKEGASDNTLIYKSRLVPLGCNEIKGIDYNETYAPVSRYTSIRILLSISAVNDFDIHVMDVTNAFPNADLNEDIYITSAPGYSLQDNKVIRQEFIHD